MKYFTLTFDDGTLDQYEYAAPLMEKYGFRGIFNLSPTLIEAGVWIGHPTMTWNNVRDLALRGHEVASHSLDHINLKPIVEQHDIKEFVRQVKTSLQILENQIGSKIGYFCYPYNKKNVMMDALVHMCGAEPMMASSRIAVPAKDFGSGVEDIEHLIKSGASKIDLMFHGIIPNGGWQPFASKEGFEDVLRTLKDAQNKGLIKVVKYSDAHNCYRASLYSRILDAFKLMNFCFVYSPLKEFNVAIKILRGLYR